MQMPNRFQLRAPEPRVALNVAVDRQGFSTSHGGFPGRVLEDVAVEMVGVDGDGSGYQAGPTPETGLESQRLFARKRSVTDFKGLGSDVGAVREELLGIRGSRRMSE